MRVGIDVGGTHTDAVIVQGEQVVASHKAVTSRDIAGGILDALRAVLDTVGPERDRIDAVMLGTTQFTNAVVERRQLSEAAVIRLGLPSGECLPPMVDWPEDLARALGNHAYMVRGGNEYDGGEISPLDVAELDSVFARIAGSAAQAVAISSVFSPLSPQMEIAAGKLLKAKMPGMPVVLSHELGRLGLLERENAALLNASLLRLSARVVDAFEEALSGFDMEAPFFISQNDGTVMTSHRVRRFPVLTFSSGQTNSMRGAARLSGIDDGMVADVGGTTTDVGMLIAGFPRESSVHAEIGGVRSNFRMPDVLSVGLGGGSVVAANGRSVGPRSVGRRLGGEALCFGGDTLTATDIAVAARRVELGDPGALDGMPAEVVDTATATMQSQFARAVEQMKTRPEPLPLIVVGGGEFLVDDRIPGISAIHRPAHCGVANAVGATLAKVSGESERLHRPGAESRERAIATAGATARQNALAGGAAPENIGDRVDRRDTPAVHGGGNGSPARSRRGRSGHLKSPIDENLPARHRRHRDRFVVSRNRRRGGSPRRSADGQADACGTRRRGVAGARRS